MSTAAGTGRVVGVGKRPHPALTITVPGKPTGQGSMRHVGRGRMIHPEALVAWRDRAVLTMTMAAQEQAWQRTTEPCQVRITAMFARPLSHYGTGRNKGVLKPSAPVFHATTPDLDKIARAVCDALTVAGIWADDKQAAELTARRQWAAEGQPDQTIIEVTLL